MSVILLTSDLLVVSHVAGAAARSGATVEAVSTAEEAAGLCRTAGAELVVVDLATPSLDVAALVTLMQAGKTKAPPIIAFGPHVHADRLDAARQAGCDQVVSRGQFFSQTDALLRR